MRIKHYKEFNETVHIIELKNGMQVHILPKEEPYYSTYVELSIPYGALDLTYKNRQKIIKTPYGTAHFLEHKMFSMPEGDAFMAFTQMGVDANAMTSYDQTSYLFMATERVMEALAYLLKMVDTPYFIKEDVESEKSIIAEELKMYLDDPNVVMHNTLMENMYYQHPIRYDIGGTLESIMAINEQVLNAVYETYYQHSNRLLTIAGKVDLEALRTFFEGYDKQFPQKKRQPKTVFKKEPTKIRKRSMTVKKDIGISKLMIGFKLEPRYLEPKAQIKREMAMAVMTNLLLGSSSTAYEALIKRKLVNQNFYVATNFEEHAENIIIYGETDQIFALKKYLAAVLLHDGRQYLTEEAFDRYKKVYTGQFIYALNNIEHKAYLYGKYYHMGANLFDVVTILQHLTLDDIVQSYEELNDTNMTTLIYKKA